MKRKFIISGGGTGGHIYPAIAIADALKARFADAEFLFVGAQDRMEMEKVPQQGYAIQGLWISGLQRRLTLKNLLFPIKLITSLMRASKIIRQFQPDIAIGTGGYASAPLLRVASRKGIPCLIQEQNSYAGITNKWLSDSVDKICVAYDGMEAFFPSEKIVFTGNPVRKDLVDVADKKEEAIRFFELSPNKKTVLVLGGSLGARAINEQVEKTIPAVKIKDVQWLWQCGKFYENEYRKYHSETVKVHPFINRMDLAYAAADVIISRSGALSVSELCLVGKPVIFIPSPNVAEDHQTKNAQAVERESGAIVIKETDLEDRFLDIFERLLQSPEKQKSLSENIRTLARPNATEEIVDEIEKMLNTKGQVK